MKLKFIKDNYQHSRGGTSKFFDIYCEHCNNFLFIYQKDGPGVLKRIYKDRIRAPEDISNLIDSKTGNLVCDKCNYLLGISTIYKKESRPAFALIAYSIVKKSSKGIL